jgi:hypothetical protein
MTVCACPTCGHPMRLEIPASDISSLLPKYQRRLYEVLLSAGSAGLDSASIYARIYADDPNGGPQSFSAIGANARQLNVKLARIGLGVQGPRDNHGYRLVRLEASPES